MLSTLSFIICNSSRDRSKILSNYPWIQKMQISLPFLSRFSWSKRWPSLISMVDSTYQVWETQHQGSTKADKLMFTEVTYQFGQNQVLLEWNWFAFLHTLRFWRPFINSFSGSKSMAVSKSQPSYRFFWQVRVQLMWEEISRIWVSLSFLHICRCPQYVSGSVFQREQAPTVQIFISQVVQELWGNMV